MDVNGAYVFVGEQSWPACSHTQGGGGSVILGLPVRCPVMRPVPVIMH